MKKGFHEPDAVFLQWKFNYLSRMTLVTFMVSNFTAVQSAWRSSQYRGRLAFCICFTFNHRLWLGLLRKRRSGLLNVFSRVCRDWFAIVRSAEHRIITDYDSVFSWIVNLRVLLLFSLFIPEDHRRISIAWLRGYRQWKWFWTPTSTVWCTGGFWKHLDDGVEQFSEMDSGVQI